MRQTTTPDYYEVLGVPHDADAETIRKAFRAQAEARAATEFLRRRTPPVAEVLVDEFEAKRGVRRKVPAGRGPSRVVCAAGMARRRRRSR